MSRPESLLDAPEQIPATEDAPVRDGAKREQILEGAREVFLARGFDAASMGDIARTAKVSKGTLYVYFDSKEALFRALMEERRRQSAEQMTPLDDNDHDVEKVLAAFARSLMTALSERKHVSLLRVVVGAAEKFPDLGREFFSFGPACSARRVGEYLAAQVKDGVLDIEDPELAAWQFLGMCKEPLMIATVLTARARPDAEEIDRYATAAAKAFVRAYRA